VQGDDGHDVSGPAPRVRAVIAAVICIAIGLTTREVFGGPSATLPHPMMKSLGDALWAAMFFWLFAAIWPRASTRRLALDTLAFTFAIEFFQLTGIPLRLAAANRLFTLLFGTTFNWPDLGAYTSGIAAAAGIRTMLRRCPASAA
jgi:hypothetical protein